MEVSAVNLSEGRVSASPMAPTTYNPRRALWANAPYASARGSCGLVSHRLWRNTRILLNQCFVSRSALQLVPPPTTTLPSTIPAKCPPRPSGKGGPGSTEKPCRLSLLLIALSEVVIDVIQQPIAIVTCITVRADWSSGTLGTDQTIPCVWANRSPAA
jgi:hypothetical protein